MTRDVKIEGQILPESPIMLTLPEVAGRLRMSVQTLQKTPRWLDRLGAVKVAGRWLVPVAHVNAVLTGDR